MINKIGKDTVIGTFCKNCRQVMCVCDFKPKESEIKVKPIHAKPSLYAFYFDVIKEIGLEYGYNIVLHGSMNRDLDLIAIPWQEIIRDKTEMLNRIAECIGGYVMVESDEDRKRFRDKFHGRQCYVININRTIKSKVHGFITKFEENIDPQYYIDISILPTLTALDELKKSE